MDSHSHSSETSSHYLFGYTRIIWPYHVASPL
jgi:hypothetical protein